MGLYLLGVCSSYCWPCACVDINKCDFIMHLTGCNYMFWSLLLSVTVDVLVSTAEGERKKKEVYKHFLLLSLPASHPPTFH